MPNTKITYATLGGALATAIIAVLTGYGISVTPELAAALATIFAAILSYLVPEPKNPDDEDPVIPV